MECYIKGHLMKFLIVFILLLFGTLFASAQDSDISPELQVELDAIEGDTITIRGLDQLAESALRFPTKADLVVYLQNEFETELPPELLESEMLFYRAFDFIPAGTDLESLLIEFYSDQIAGFYDPEIKEMNVILFNGEQVGDELPLLETIIYAHEFVHMLQDQHFDLVQFLEVDATVEPDRALAQLALIEGDATVVMNEYTIVVVDDNPIAALAELLTSGVDPSAFFLPEGLPEILEDELTFPYFLGQEFVAELIQSGGWEQVNRAFTNPPVSTEQIYHPERYLAGELPIEVFLTDRSDLLGEDWLLAHDRTLGEFYLRQYLATQFDSRETINLAATGWGGDRYHIYHNPTTDDIIWTLHLVWDTPQDASEFLSAYVEFGDSRFESEQNGNCWSNTTETLCITGSGKSEVLISFAPELSMAQTLMGAP